MSTERFVSPVADEVGEPWRAARRPALEGTIALVDSMRNTRSNWGAGILDGAEQAVAARFPSVAFERIQRPFVPGTNPSDLWAETMAARYAALVITGGD